MTSHMTRPRLRAVFRLSTAQHNKPDAANRAWLSGLPGVLGCGHHTRTTRIALADVWLGFLGRSRIGSIWLLLSFYPFAPGR